MMPEPAPGCSTDGWAPMSSIWKGFTWPTTERGPEQEQLPSLLVDSPGEILTGDHATDHRQNLLNGE